MILPNANDGSICVCLNKEDKEYCEKIARIRKKRGKWDGVYGGGVLNTPEDPVRAERTGVYAEKAFNLMTGLPVDEEERPNGDPGWDFILPNSTIKVDAKNSVALYSKFFVHAANESLVVGEPKSDFYVFSYNYFHPDLPEKDADNIWIKIVGAISKKTLLAKDRIGEPLTKKGYENGKPKWLNYYIEPEELTDAITFFWKIRKHIQHEETDLYCL